VNRVIDAAWSIWLIDALRMTKLSFGRADAFAL
jgi:hypothetical protein